MTVRPTIRAVARAVTRAADRAIPPIAIAMGVAVGLAAAAAATHLLAALLHGVAPRDPATFLLTTGIVLAVAATACWLPARLAGRLDPLAVLRAE